MQNAKLAAIRNGYDRLLRRPLPNDLCTIGALLAGTVNGCDEIFHVLLVLFLPVLFSSPPDESVAACEKTESGNLEGRPTEQWFRR